MPYFVDVFYIPSCISGSRNTKTAKLENTRSIGIPVARVGMEKRCKFLRTFILQVYIQSDQLRKPSLLRIEFYIRLNCHCNCTLPKLSDMLKNTINTCSIKVEVIFRVVFKVSSCILPSALASSILKVMFASLIKECFPPHHSAYS